MAPQLYLPIYFTVIGILCGVYSFRFFSSPDHRLQEERSGMLFPVLLCLILVLWLGYRPINAKYFGDTLNYAREYRALDGGVAAMDWSYEWIWRLLMLQCKALGLSVEQFFTVIEFGYIFSVLWAVKKFVPNNPMVGMLFVLSSLMFFTFGTNGLRNGLACHIILLAMAFFLADTYWAAALLALVAFGIHRTVFLPIFFIILARFGIKDFKISVWFWIACIFLSVLLGSFFISFFSSLGFDDRMSRYADSDEFDESFSSTGFRWDFLIYSVPPILLGWYALQKKKIIDGWYRCLCITYCYCNAFWILVIRSAFSNRFAYLSWFMYPILIAYPLLNLPIWEDQDRKTGAILLLYVLFSIFMNLVVW